MRADSQTVTERTLSAPSAKNVGNVAPVVQRSPWHVCHRSIGNAQLARVLQVRLTVAHPHDVYEQEADRVADEVMRTP
jgi:hypothetical protein